MSEEKQMCEEATGCAERPNGTGTIYRSGGFPVESKEDCMECLREGFHLEVPNAGAGSYRSLFTQVFGFKEIKVVDWGSSAGDWTFAVKDGDIWYPAFQSNRYPRYGFEYSVNFNQGFESFEQLCESAF